MPLINKQANTMPIIWKEQDSGGQDTLDIKVQLTEKTQF